MTNIFHNGVPVAQGEVFEPMPGYQVRYVRMESDRLVLRDAAGEFTRPIIHRPDPNEPRPAPSPRLGDRRTVLEEVPDSRPMVGETIYLMTHQMCVPGGWEDVTSRQLRAPENHGGVYGPKGQMLESTWLRQVAVQLFKDANRKLANHPYVRLDKLVTTVDNQEGKEGTPGAWDDPGVAMEICEILRKSRTL